MFWNKSESQPIRGLCSAEPSLCVAYSGVYLAKLDPAERRMPVALNVTSQQAFTSFVSSGLRDSTHMLAVEGLRPTDFQVEQKSMTLPALEPPSSITRPVVPEEASRVRLTLERYRRKCITARRSATPMIPLTVSSPLALRPIGASPSAYDGFGNLWSKTVTAGSAPPLSINVDGNNHISTAGFVYDANGNLLQQPLMTSQCGYDAENRMVTAPGVQYGYDGQNKRNYKADVNSQGGVTWEEFYFYGADGQRLWTYYLQSPTVFAAASGSPFVYLGRRRIEVEDRLGSTNAFYPYGEQSPSALVTVCLTALVVTLVAVTLAP